MPKRASFSLMQCFGLFFGRSFCFAFFAGSSNTAARGRDGSDGCVITVGQLYKLHTLRQLDVRQVDGVACFQVGQIYFDKVLRQAAYVGFGHGVCDHAMSQLDARGDIGIDEVERNLDVDLFSGAYALEVDVLNIIAYRVHLVVTQQYLFLLAVQIQVHVVRVDAVSVR